MSEREDLLIIAHRGASADHAENTRDAFLGAANQGADWVELDVRMARDGGLIVHHDAWYHDQRTVWSTPTEERPRRVLTLEEALDACREARPMGVNVEIKNLPDDLGGPEVPHSLEVVDMVVDLMARRTGSGISEDILVSSFHPPTIDRVRRLGGPPTGQLVLSLRDWPDVVDSTSRRGHRAVHPHDHLVDPVFVGAAGRAGLDVNVWTVDDARRIRELASLGVTGVVTNVPAVAREALGAGPG